MPAELCQPAHPTNPAASSLAPELWRALPTQEKHRYKTAALAERQRYQAAKERLTHEQQAATAAALAAGADAITAAKAGMQARQGHARRRWKRGAV